VEEEEVEEEDRSRLVRAETIRASIEEEGRERTRSAYEEGQQEKEEKKKESTKT
jgi:hypothetical protein